ncbi:hypothetical protein JNW89_32480, partial [Micromonospora sp. 4G55]|nr:hypothetical protein [Micromonospora sp. 4G55]
MIFSTGTNRPAARPAGRRWPPSHASWPPGTGPPSRPDPALADRLTPIADAPSHASWPPGTGPPSRPDPALADRLTPIADAH